ncbi:MAG TPA: discoidin domain-containing protein [Thermoanaerobaculia bacterium]|nr:discoidin domain-containing protein [Thermoanaerobaculia bacterium]
MANAIGGTGRVEARGPGGVHRSGGGGAVAIEYGTSTGTVLANASAASGASQYAHGGPGTVYLKSATSTYGDLVIDNAGVNWSDANLPSLGNGTALTGTSGATLVTDRSTNIPAYFAGHWVEITSATGTVKGLWRIATINTKTVTLTPNGSETINLAVGDAWQGIYRFDKVRLSNYGKVTSADPIRTTDFDVPSGVVELRSPIATTNTTVSNGAQVWANSIKAQTMTVAGTLSQYWTDNNSLDLDVAGTLTVASTGVIDATGRGYAPNVTYPGASTPGYATSGSHLGFGGVYENPPGSTYGSVYRPREAGGGANRGPGDGNYGGGAIRIQAATLTNDGTIRANGGTGNYEAGGGGSVWITAPTIGGSGRIDARGGGNVHRSGGGGAISIEYTTATGTVLNNLGTAPPPSQYAYGAPGSVYTKGGTSTYGDIRIDNEGRNGPATILPSLGRGNAITGTSGAVVVTDASANFPAYFAGHYVDVFTPSGSRKGTWRIASITGKTFTLQPNASETIDVVAGDTWRGVYLFDKMTLRNAFVSLLDDIRSARDLDSVSTLTINDPPVLNAALISTVSRADGDFVAGVAGAVTDLHPPITLIATNKRTSATFSGTAAGDGSFAVAVTGVPGDTFTLRATDSFTLRATSATIDVTGALANNNAVASVTLATSTAVSGKKVDATVRMKFPVRGATGVVTLTSSDPSVTVPATVTIPSGASAVSFSITTPPFDDDRNVTITATNNNTSQSATLLLLDNDNGITIGLAPSTVIGGQSMNGTVILGMGAPAGGATVTLASSDTRLATVPSTVFIPAGTSSADFTVTTYAVAANASVRISGTYGSSNLAFATITACSGLGAVAKPAAPALDATWVDDATPGNVTPTGDSAIDASQAATGTSSIHLTGAAGTHTFAFTGATAFPVTPNDKLVLYALANPCNPPKQILVGFKAGSSEYRASWGESRIEVTTSHTRMGSLPGGAEWVRLEVPAKAIGITSNVSFTELSVRSVDGEAWIDSIGKSGCVLTQAPPPQYGPNEQVWFDDDLPAGATTLAAGGFTSAWTWDTTQIASGTRSQIEPLRSGFHDHLVDGAAEPFAAGRADVLFAYVYLDPCNPPRMVMLQWGDGVNWNHRAFWGESLSPLGGSEGTPSRWRVGPLPPAGGWVRLEVPAQDVGLAGSAIRGMALGVYDGQAWFDRVGKVARVNVALGKTAKQSSDYAPQYPASRAVDGNIASTDDSFSVTANNVNPWWEVDLGASYSIDTIDVRGRTDCCPDQTSSFFVFVSDVPFTASDYPTIRAQSGVSSYAIPGTANPFISVAVRRTGRYVRIQRTNNGNLTLPEVEVWAAAAAMRTNIGAGRATTTGSSTWDTWGNPENANNGVVNNGYSSGGSMFHTRSGGDTDAWWEVDMGAVQPISTIDVWGRIDCCADQTANYYILVSDVPFTSKVFATSIAQAGVSVYFNGPQKTVVSFPINRTGRYVRMQRQGTGQFVSLDELQVWGQQPTLKPMSKPADPAGATQ